MTAEKLMKRICESLEFWGGSRDVAGVVVDVEETNAEPSNSYRSALAHLILAGDVEEYTDSSQMLRLIGEARRRAEERQLLRIQLNLQESVPIVSLFVNDLAIKLATESRWLIPPTDDSFWWEAHLDHRQREFPISEILDGTWHGPVVLPMRVTYKQATDDGRMLRTGGVYPVPFDYLKKPDGDELILVGRVPDGVVPGMPIEGAYLWGSISTADNSLPEPIQGTYQPSVRESNSGPTSDGIPMVVAAVGLTDQTAEDFIFMALEQVGISPVVYSHRGCTVWVAPNEKDLAIRVLQEDSRKYSYKIMTVGTV